MLHQFRREETQCTHEQAEASLRSVDRAGVSVLVDRMGLSCGAGRWPSKGRGKKGSPRCARAWLPTGPRGQRCDRPYFLALLAEAYGKVGQAEEGLTALAEALAVVDKTGERFYEAELYRLKGELTLQQVSESQRSRVKKLPIPNP